jgi:phospholipid transport system substrate-binding protein
VASYVAAFDTYKGESFRILPGVRTLGGNKVLVQTRLLKGDGPPVRFDYVMHLGSTGWRAVDLLLGGEISRVQLQRLYFEDLLRQGGAPALLAFLEWKLTDLSGPMV